MAEALLDSSDCFLCHEKLKDPVSLDCEHSFCYRCLQEHWDLNTAGDCPKCRRRSSKDLPMTFALKEKIEFSPTQMESSEEQTVQEEVTRKHPEDDILFMSDTRDAFTQTEASAKEKLQPEVQKKCPQTVSIYSQSDMLQHTERQARSCAVRIRKQFEHLHLILAQEEALCLNSLRKEKEEKTLRIQLKLKDIDAKLSSVSPCIKSAEEQLQTESSDPLSDIRDSNEPDPPEPEPGLLIDEARVLGNLGYRVWQKMGTVIKHSPVVLDPNTANSFLHLSEDLTSVRREDTEQDVPLNPERFKFSTSVLGSEGFSSGTHRWDVEVGDHPNWTIGLVKESVKRDTTYYPSPQNGLWCLMHRNDKYSGCIGGTLKLKRRPERIRVELDYEAGRVSFSDPKDMSLIYSHRDTFTEKLFPYFFVRQVEGATVTKDIKIHQSPVNPEVLTSAALTLKASEAQELPRLESELERLELELQTSAALTLKASKAQEPRRLDLKLQESWAKKKSKKGKTKKKKQSETKAEVPEVFTPKSSSDPGPSESPEKEPQTVLKEEQEPPAESSETQSHT